MLKYEIGGRICYIEELNQNANKKTDVLPVLIVWSFLREEEEILKLRNAVFSAQNDASVSGKKTQEEKSFLLVICTTTDWDGELSPWKMVRSGSPDISHSEANFSGYGKDTLLWMQDKLIPFLKTSHPDQLMEIEKHKLKFYTVGYSLAGLFALWCVYESDFFSGCVCGSGSLWFDGWDSYMEKVMTERKQKKHQSKLIGIQNEVQNGSRGIQNEVQNGSGGIQNEVQRELNSMQGEEKRKSDGMGEKSQVVYLSLGGKEEKTKIPYMQSVGDRTRKQAELLKTDPFVSQSILEWNPGGHFGNSEGRIAKGIGWLLQHI